MTQKEGGIHQTPDGAHTQARTLTQTASTHTHVHREMGRAHVELGRTHDVLGHRPLNHRAAEIKGLGFKLSLKYSGPPPHKPQAASG